MHALRWVLLAVKVQGVQEFLTDKSTRFSPTFFPKCFCPFLTSDTDLTCWEHASSAYHFTFLWNRMQTSLNCGLKGCILLRGVDTDPLSNTRIVIKYHKKTHTRAQFFTASFITILCPLLYMEINSLTQIHALSVYDFTFWIHALKWKRCSPHVRLWFLAWKKWVICTY
jgi:hypothetical protein